MLKRHLYILVLLACLTCPVSVFSQQPEHPRFAPDEVLVKFRSGVSGRKTERSHFAVGSRKIKHFKRHNTDHVKIPPGWTVEKTIEKYGLDPDVEYAEPNYYRHATVTPDDTYFGLQWGLDNDGSGGTEDADMDAPEAWGTQTGSSSVVIAILDTGVDLDHEDLVNNLWTNTGEDWVDGSPGNDGSDNDGNGKIDDYYGWDFPNNDNSPDDDQAGVYHGTHVAGTIGAEGNNGTGIAGVCWSVSVMALKVFDGAGYCSIADEIEAIDYAVDNGAKIMNASFGGADFSQLEYDAIRAARDAGVLFVTAAGNTNSGGTDNDSSPIYPASCDLANIISVAATDENDELAYFSHYGKVSVDVAAPGVNIYSTMDGDSYQYMSGTSMAAPHVAGLAGLILAQDSSLTYSQVKASILNGVDAIADLNQTVASGGRVNANTSLGLPNPPANLSATAPSGTATSLTWTDNSSAETGYTVERKTGSGGAYSEIDAVEADVTSYTDTGLDAETAYYYRIRAYNSLGYSGYCSEACVNCTSSGSDEGSSSGSGCFISTATPSPLGLAKK